MRINKQTPRPPAFVLLFMSIFGFIGITILVFLWRSSGFGAPPTIFKIFGSFIALGFIVMGFGMPLSILMRTRKSGGVDSDAAGNPYREKKPGSYDCPGCGANIEDGDVSPSGDIKCTYCDSWWNIHRA